MTGVVTKMQGLKTLQNFNTVCLNAYANLPNDLGTVGPTYTGPISDPLVVMVNDPAILRIFMQSNLGMLADDKGYLRQYKVWTMMRNSLNVDLMVQVLYFRVRKNVTADSWSSMLQLFGSNAYVLGEYPYFKPTLSNDAQRYLKFGKTKYIYLPPNRTRRISMGVKYRQPRLVTRDVEGNPQYLATGISKGYLIIPMPVPVGRQLSSTVIQPVAPYPSPVRLEIFTGFYISGYEFDGEANNPENVVTVPSPGVGSYSLNQYNVYPSQINNF